MGQDVAAAFPAARDAFAAADEALGEPLTALCFGGPAETLTRTEHAQPALLAHSAAVWAVVRELIAPQVRAVAGHSLGEFSGWHAAGTLALGDAVRLVRCRGTLMAQTGVARPGTMAAILGALAEPIEEICARASVDPEGGLVVAANYNAPGQVVISGEVPGVEHAMARCKSAGAKRAIRLNVSGAFHSPLMEPARDGLADALRDIPMSDPRVPLYANVSAAPVRDVTAARTLLVEQLTAPVRWTQVVLAMVAAYPDAIFVEMGTGSVLTGLMKKIAPDVVAVSCGTATEIEQLLARFS